MTLLQFGAIAGIDALTIVGGIGALIILAGAAFAAYWAYMNGLIGGGGNADDAIAEALRQKRGDADALAFLPYDDGTFYFKPCNFDKELIGGQGGYETVDGDKIVLDGGGEPVKSLFGVDVVLGVDPTEHAGAVEPIKALMAHKKDIGEWLRVDREGHVIEAGEALLPAPNSDIEIDDIGPENSPVVQERAEDIMSDGGIVRKEIAMERAIEELEREGMITRIFDLAPPSAPVMTDDGMELEQATHIAVDQSEGSDLMPTTTSTTELNTALDKARMEEYDEGKLLKYAGYGAAATFIGETVIVGLLFLLFQL
jgi:hypothetical protein